MGIKELHNDTLRKLPNEYGDVSVMRIALYCFVYNMYSFGTASAKFLNQASDICKAYLVYYEKNCNILFAGRI